jgi:hypothetical protein
MKTPLPLPESKKDQARLVRNQRIRYAVAGTMAASWFWSFILHEAETGSIFESLAFAWLVVSFVLGIAQVVSAVDES